ncbi:MAG: chorismate synthase [Planctomycetota bacterium]|jgi:chorismate synthase
MLRYLTAGESHGRALTGVLEGIPSDLPLGVEDIDRELKRRQGGHGRGGRMKIESDRVQFLSGVRWGRTIGSPITLLIENKDWENWKDGMSPDAGHEGTIEPVTRPRPGHADLAGALKFVHHDIRNVLERSSARETAMRVALGAVCKRFLGEFGMRIGSFITEIGPVAVDIDYPDDVGLWALFEKAETSSVRCPDEAAAKKMTELIDKANEDGDSLGGVFTVFALGVPPGLGNYVQWDKRLEGRLSHALMSVQAVKGVSVGLGFEAARRLGSEVMDEIEGTTSPFRRSSNNAGGIEGGISNGMPIILRAAMKPIPTLKRPLKSVDIIKKEPVEAAYERSDVCAVPAAAVIGEAMTALTIADAFMEKFGGDSMGETKKNVKAYLKSIEEF